MPTVESECQAARRQLEKVLASPGFARNERLSRFLRFAVERHLEGRDGELKESLIAIEVFGRAPGYDSKKDPIVRTEAGRLWERLAEYYLGEGKGDSPAIELPKGGYVPVFRFDEPDSLPAPPAWRKHLLKIAAATAGVVALLGAGWWRLHQSAPIPIAVLPFENLSHDPATDYYADGITDELIRNLSLIEGLAPRSRTSSFFYRAKPRNIRELGRELNVDYVLEGEVLQTGHRLRVITQLIRVRDDSPIWSHDFDGDVTDVLALQDEIALGIVNQLRLKLGQGRRRYEISADAYDSYLRARESQSKDGLAGYSESIRLYQEAIAKDHSLAPAYAGLAGAYAATSATIEHLDHQGTELAEMQTAAQKALQLDPLLAEAYDALAMADARNGRWEPAERNFLSAIDKDPNSSKSRGDYAMFLLYPQGRTKQALQQLRAAEEADPLSPEIQNYLGHVLLASGRYDDAAGHCEKLPESFRGKPECLGRAR